MNNHDAPPRYGQGGLAVIALACIAPSAGINVMHLLAHTPGALALPLAAASVLSVALAAASPFAIEKALAGRNFALLIIALLTSAVCLSYNLSVAIGAASIARAEVTGARTAENNRAQIVTSQLASAEKSRAALAAVSGEKTPGMLTAEISGLEQSTAWTSSRQCTDATLPASRAFCQDHAAKLAALDAARKVEVLDAEIASLKATLLKTGQGTGQPADVQAANIAAALAFVGVRVEAANIAVALNLSLAVLVELVGAFGPLVFAAAFRRQVVEAPADQPAPVPLPQETPAAPVKVEDKGKTKTKTKAERKAPSKPRRPRRSRAKTPKKEASAGCTILQLGDVVAERKRRVAELRADGKTQLEIAAELGLSVSTIKRL